MNKVIAKVDRKYAKLGVHWRGSWINFCSLRFTRENSFYFSSKFYYQGQLQSGTSDLKDNTFCDKKPDGYFAVKNGFHISLHPKGQVMHLKDHATKAIIDERKINWHPVKKAFNFLLLFSPPLDMCQTEKDKSDFNAPIDEQYKDSIRLKLDIYPTETKEHLLSTDSIWVFWGFCPDYKICISMDYARCRTETILYWPENSILSL